MSTFLKLTLVGIAFIQFSLRAQTQDSLTYCATNQSIIPQVVQLNNTTWTLKILLVEFTDVQHNTSPAYTFTNFNNLFFSTGIYVSPNMYSPDGQQVFGSMKDYLYKMSDGEFNISGFVVNHDQNSDGNPDWLILPHSKVEYDSYTFPFTSDAIAAANTAGLDISTNSTTKLAIIYAGHTYRAGALNPRISNINTYIMGEKFAPGSPYNTERPDAKFSHIGINTHEFSHLLGLDDLYGNGRWDLMNGGEYIGPAYSGECPAPMNPKSRLDLGWINIVPITSNQTFQSDYNLQDPEVFQVKNSIDASNYWLIETRRFDATMTIGNTVCPDYNYFLLRIYHVNPPIQGTLVWRVTSNYPYGRLLHANGKTWSDHPSVFPGDPFPGTDYVKVLSPWSDPRNPNNLDWIPNTKPSTNVGLEIIQEGNGYYIVDLYATNPQNASPSRPYNPQLSSVTSGSTTLQWYANQEPDLVGYNIYRGVIYEGSGEPTYTKINSSPITSNSFTDNNYESINGLPQNIDLYHRYRITAVDNQNKESVKSDYVDAYFTRLVSGTIQSGQTWQIDVRVVEYALINFGVTITVSQLSRIFIDDSQLLTNNGTLLFEGNSTLQFGTNSSLEIYGTVRVADYTNLVFPPSSVVNVHEGAQFNMGANSEIVVDGKLIVTGTMEQHIVFSTESPEVPWRGFSFGSQSYESVLEYADITNAGIGVSTIFNNGLRVSNCTISNGEIGIYLYNSGQEPPIYTPVIVQNNYISGENVAGIYADKGASDIIIQNNTIEGMNDWGAGMQFIAASPLHGVGNVIRNCYMSIYCAEASPSFTEEESGGNNCFSGNDYGVFAEYSSNLILGNIDEQHSPGMNSIADNRTTQITLRENCYVFSQMNYYRHGGPDLHQDFQVDESSKLIYKPYLEEDPLRCASTKMFVQQNESNDEPLVSFDTDPRIKLAIKKRMQGNNAGAMGILKSIINTESNIDIVRWAIRELLANFQMVRNPHGNNALSNYLYARLQSSTSEEVKRSIRGVLSGALLHERNSNGALAMLNESIQLYPNTASELLALYGKVSLALNSLSNITLATNTLQLLQAKYPNERLTKLAETLVQTATATTSKSSTHNLTATEKSKITKDIPKEFSLEQNFPNPFNPVTVIRYQLPVSSEVTLKIYDVLGRETATLVNGYEEAGYKSVTFDAGKLPSGIYFYKMVSGNYVSVKKLVVMK
jgi:M6 family metalloprotease-like protein